MPRVSKLESIGVPMYAVEQCWLLNNPGRESPYVAGRLRARRQQILTLMFAASIEARSL